MKNTKEADAAETDETDKTEDTDKPDKPEDTDTDGVFDDDRLCAAVAVACSFPEQVAQAQHRPEQ